MPTRMSQALLPPPLRAVSVRRLRRLLPRQHCTAHAADASLGAAMRSANNSAIAGSQTGASSERCHAAHGSAAARFMHTHAGPPQHARSHKHTHAQHRHEAGCMRSVLRLHLIALARCVGFVADSRSSWRSNCASMSVLSYRQTRPPHSQTPLERTRAHDTAQTTCSRAATARSSRTQGADSRTPLTRCQAALRRRESRRRWRRRRRPDRLQPV